MEENTGEWVQQALFTLKNADAFVAVEFLNRGDDPIAVMKAYRDLLNQLYWKKKDLPTSITLALSGINYGLTFGYGRGSAELRYDLRSLAKTLAYNLAAFTWPGWDEPGIAIGPAAAMIGLESARLNLRLAEELQKGDIPLARGHWMLGAQFLANHDRDKARTHFRESARFAGIAGSLAEVELAHGFIALAQRIDAPGDPAPAAEFEAIRKRIVDLPEGRTFLQQLLTAERVFGVPFD